MAETKAPFTNTTETMSEEDDDIVITESDEMRRKALGQLQEGES